MNRHVLSSTLCGIFAIATVVSLHATVAMAQGQAGSTSQPQSSTVVDEKQAASLGKLVGAQVVVVGSLTKLGEALTVNVRFVDATTGEATVAESRRTRSESELPKVVNQLAARLAGLSWPLRTHRRPGAVRRPARGAAAGPGSLTGAP